MSLNVSERHLSADTAPVLQMQGIVKRFGAMTAVAEVDFDVRAGEIHALLGENGAGKSTLMNCLFGLESPDEGQILIAGARVTVASPKRAQELGIGMVHQHFKLVPSLTVAENVFLGSEPHYGPFLRRRAATRRVAELARTYGLDVRPTEKVGSLSVGAQQRVEILRALAREVRILVLDEPTAVLTTAETERFFEVIKGFAAQGLAIILISHHLKEVRQIADRVTVLRRGRKVADAPIGDLTNRDLASLIIGEERPVASEVPLGQAKEVRLDVRALTLKNGRGIEVVHGVDFSVSAGEIVGILGIAGNGQSELVEAITGLRRPSAGTVLVNGADVTGGAPGRFRAAGIGHVPEDRIGRGMAGLWSVQNNIAAGYLDTQEVGGRILSEAKTAALVRRLMQRFNVRANAPKQLARRLSGGNAQKMVLARELSRKPSIVVLRGTDTRPRHRGHGIRANRTRGPTRRRRRRALGFQRDRGSYPDRRPILVMSSGSIVAEFSGRRPTEAEVGRAMLGEQP